MNSVRPISSKVYKIFKKHHCGPLDGGCLMYAVAYQRVHGGDLWGLRGYHKGDSNKVSLIQHVVVKQRDLFHDAEGSFTLQQMKNRWERLEHIHVDSFEPLPPMPTLKEILHNSGIPYNEVTVKKLESELRERRFNITKYLKKKEANSIYLSSDTLFRELKKKKTTEQIAKEFDFKSPIYLNYLIELRNKLSLLDTPNERFDALNRVLPQTSDFLLFLALEEYWKGGEIGGILRKYELDPRIFRGMLSLVGIYNNRLKYLAQGVYRSYALTRDMVQTSKQLGISLILVKKALAYKGVKPVSRRDITTKLIQDNKEDIINYYTIKKMSAGDIAKKYKVNETTIEKYLKIWEIPIRGYPKSLPSGQYLYNLMQRGATMMDLAIKYDVDKSSILRKIVAAGHRKPKKGHAFLSTEKELTQLKKDYETMSASAIAKKYNTTVIVILNRLRRLGLEIKRKRIGGTWRGAGYISPADDTNIVNKVIEMRKEGITIPSIASTLGLRDGQILYVIKQNKIPPSRKLKYSQKFRDMLVAKYKSGQTPNEIGREIKMIPEHIRYLLKKEGLDLTKSSYSRIYPPEVIEEQNKVIIALTHKGKGSRYIADKLGLDHSTILERRKKLGLGTYGGVSRTTMPEVVWKNKSKRAGYLYYIKNKKPSEIAKILKVGERNVLRLLADIDKYYKYQVSYYDKDGEKITVGKTFTNIREAEGFRQLAAKSSLTQYPPRLQLLKKK